jgi:uncharacterized protein (TIGR02145 family)
MKNLLQKIFAIVILLIAIQITLTAQPVGSQIKVGTDSQISYWDGVSSWIPVTPDLPGKSLQFTAGVPAWVNNPNGITTTAAASITGTTAVSGGNILSDGGATITARGVCWSTSPNPTLALSTKTTDGIGIGSFTTNVTGLSSGTTYYVRAYSTNSEGTAYGNEISFATTSLFPVVDIDGNGYDTVHIGTQVWMKQNLNTSRYNNGSQIPNVTDNTTWASLSTGARCYYNNDSLTYANTYGTLYNWYTVNTGNLCPTGWHVPSDAEWTTLTTYLGGENIAGGKLKEADLAHWNWPNLLATNETNFTALPGGYRGYSGTFVAIGYDGYWWSSTAYSSVGAWHMQMSFSSNLAYIYNYGNTIGFNVRCLRD